jgi:Ca2+-binding RTX toxin-like protein
MIYSTILKSSHTKFKWGFNKKIGTSNPLQPLKQPYNKYPYISALQLSNFSTGGNSLFLVIFDNPKGVSGKKYIANYFGSKWTYKDDMVAVYKDINKNNKLDKKDKFKGQFSLYNDYSDFGGLPSGGGQSEVYSLGNKFYLAITTFTGYKQKHVQLHSEGKHKYVSTLKLSKVKKGSKKANKLNGTNGKDYIIGMGGNDKIFGRNSSDIVFGEKGNDLLYGGSGNDIIIGGSGNDELIGGIGNDKLIGGSGKDIFKLSNGKGYDLIEDFKNKQDKIFFGSIKKINLKNKSKDVFIYSGKDLLAKVKKAKGLLSKKGKYLV